LEQQRCRRWPRWHSGTCRSRRRQAATKPKPCRTPPPPVHRQQKLVDHLQRVQGCQLDAAQHHRRNPSHMQGCAQTEEGALVGPTWIGRSGITRLVDCDWLRGLEPPEFTEGSRRRWRRFGSDRSERGLGLGFEGGASECGRWAEPAGLVGPRGQLGLLTRDFLIKFRKNPKVIRKH
jgi:hypothetical protein